MVYLEFSSLNKIGNKGNTASIRIEDNRITVDKKRRENDPKLSSLTFFSKTNVKVCYNIFDKVEEDISCDSKYKIPSMYRVG